MLRLHPFRRPSSLSLFQVAHGIACGLDFMHVRGFVHRDCTSYNVLLEMGGPGTHDPGSFVAKV